jgi:hypothetical protein
VISSKYLKQKGGLSGSPFFVAHAGVLFAMLCRRSALSRPKRKSPATCRAFDVCD